MTNKTDFLLDGDVINRGKWLMRGTGGLTGVRSFNNKGTSEFQMPLLDPVDVGAAIPASARLITTNSFLNSGAITVYRRLSLRVLATLSRKAQAIL